MPALRRCSASRSMAASASRPKMAATHISRRYRKDTLILETSFETAEGAVTLIDFMPIRGHNPDCVRIVVGEHGRVPMCAEVMMALRLWCDRALGTQARRRRAARHRRPRYGRAAHAGAPARRKSHDGRRIRRQRRRSRAVRDELRAFASARAGSLRRRRRTAGYRKLLAGVVRTRVKSMAHGRRPSPAR